MQLTQVAVIQGGMSILLYKNHSEYPFIAACIAVRVSITIS